jgi:hypothetical protein
MGIFYLGEETVGQHEKNEEVERPTLGDTNEMHRK